MNAWLKRTWAAANAATVGTEEYWTISVDHRSMRSAMLPLIERYVRGRTLDAGAGQLAWRPFLRARASDYLAVDRGAGHPDLDLCCDLEGRIPLPDGSIDTIFCCSVLEHTHDPAAILREFRRILRPGGHVVLSVPFLYYLHDPPRDYWRFSRYCVANMAESAELDVIECTTCGGLFHLAFHAVSMISTSILWQIQAPSLASGTAWLLSKAAGTLDAVDREGLFAQYVNAVLRRAPDRP